MPITRRTIGALIAAHDHLVQAKHHAKNIANDSDLKAIEDACSGIALTIYSLMFHVDNDHADA